MADCSTPIVFAELLQDGYVNDLPTQFSEPFCSEASNQCSWFAVGAIAKRDELVSAWREGPELFRKVYEQLLSEATRMKKHTDPDGKLVQTAYHSHVLEHWKVSLGECLHLEIHPDEEDFLQEGLEQVFVNAAEVKQIKLGLPLGTFTTLREDLRILSMNPAAGHCFLGHRASKAFAALPVGNGNFLVVDSQV
eukprot:gnl/MRDRNA2_/MRDRNA2_148246_c0_seq1.p1 gnl/MRDRNA2_/MRDRNA2_148246_c0~~gnl/MRDRNA2_/MRDRNA2_148246_c0_seq1.p1  ORF type:complete len:193 (+),score=36.57 gnl/MRDRNA2_/MRDRNA2_148246_c0_seq1:155-733(+)